MVKCYLSDSECVQGLCLKDKAGNPYCQCAGSYYGDDCETKSEFAYIAGGE